MSTIPRPSVGALALALGVLAACRTDAPAPAPEKVEPVAAGAPAAAEAPAEATPAPAPPLTEEELALIAADPKDLTPELRRKRAYARRKQIMQNPDSPTARALSDLAEAHRSGELDVQRKGEGTWFSAPGSKPTSGRPPAGWRPSDGEAKPAPAGEAKPADAAVEDAP